jgi:hypothetical protein
MARQPPGLTQVPDASVLVVQHVAGDGHVTTEALSVRECGPADRARVLPVARDDAGRVGDIGS